MHLPCYLGQGQVTFPALRNVSGSQKSQAIHMYVCSPHAYAAIITSPLSLVVFKMLARKKKMFSNNLCCVTSRGCFVPFPPPFFF